MKKILRFCDRCQQEITTTDDRITDFLEGEYQGKDICQDCDSQIDLAAQVTRQAQISGQSEQQVLSDWLAIYE